MPTQNLPVTIAAALLCAARVAPADFVGLRVESATAAVGTPECLTTHRIFALFDDPLDRLLAVGGEPGAPFVLNFFAGQIVNDPDSKVAGTIAEDFPAAPIGAAWDSFFTIGSDPTIGNDTLMAPGFAGSDGVSAVLTGSNLLSFEGSWYDSDPQTPEDGGSVLIMQLTVDPSECVLVNIQGVAYWRQGAQVPIYASEFLDTLYCGACDGDVDGSQVVDFGDLLIVLSNWGPCGGRCCRADLNGDGLVGFDDLLTVLERWGFSCIP